MEFTEESLKNKYLSFKIFYQKMSTKYIADQTQMGVQRWFQQKQMGKGAWETQ